jgi:hypothetical protein
MASVLAAIPRVPFSLDRLIAEAKRRARQRRLAATVLVLAMVVAAATLFALRVSDRVAAVSGRGPCRNGQLRATAAQLPGAAVTVGWVIRYRNVSPSACTLSGYPTISVSASGLSEAATHSRLGMLGGVSSLPTSLPRVLLRDRNAVASSTVEFFGDPITDLPCPGKRATLRFRSLSVTMPGGGRSFALPVSRAAVCSRGLATPIVPGSTGTLPASSA